MLSQIWVSKLTLYIYIQNPTKKKLDDGPMSHLNWTRLRLNDGFIWLCGETLGPFCSSQKNAENYDDLYLFIIHP